MASDLFERGLAIRRSVLGDAYVDEAMARRTKFNTDLQDLVTEYCWGSIWGRDQLSKVTRSLLHIVMRAAWSRLPGLALHVQGAIRTGVTEDEIAEARLQASVYARVPAGVDAFRVAGQAVSGVGPAEHA